MGVLGIIISPDWQNKELRNTYVAQNLQNLDPPGLASELMVFMHYVEILIALPCPCVIFCCVDTCCYTCMDMLHTLISYVLLILHNRVNLHMLCIESNETHFHLCVLEGVESSSEIIPYDSKPVYLQSTTTVWSI